jgi:hypothetical protein
MNTNPFNITKAVDYSDEQIFNYWVDLPNIGFTDIIKPTSPMPMIILGAKGSGKTHIMRYFSFSLQSLRFNNQDLLEGIVKDGYIGIYMRCSGLNSDRFAISGLSKEIWKNLFSYYMELWLAQLLLNNIRKMGVFKHNSSNTNELEITKEILDQFDKVDNKESIVNLDLLASHLKELQKKVDYEINNYRLTGGTKLNIEITISPGRLIFGLPQILIQHIAHFEHVKFLYLIDEFENLKEYQQQYFNTLIREKEDPVTFKVGARLYGLRTFKTFSAEEELKEGSEYESYNIDKIFRDRESDYNKFVSDICIKRLYKHGYQVDDGDFNKYFEKSNIQQTNISQEDKKYFKDLEKRLNGFPPKTITEIISNLIFEKDIILERTNVLIFYRHWKKGNKDLALTSNKIREDCKLYFDTKNSESEHANILEYYKFDIIDQLYREIYSNILYTGFTTFVKMSAGIPKNLMIILKHIFRWSSFNNEEPFIGNNKISIESQINGLKDASDWFLNDARVICDDPSKVRRSIDRIGRFLQELRFSDLPPECSISTFSISMSNLNAESQKVIDYLEQYSYLIPVNPRRDKNTNRKDLTFQINGIIAPVWELSLQRRGVIRLNKNETMAIFEIDDEKEFNKILNSRKSECNAPFHIESLKLPFR